ncbi:MAG: RecX family transcriptional regulator, partial [Bacteroidota bacterium]
NHPFSEIEQKLRDNGIPTKDWPIIMGMLQAEKFWDEERYVRSFSRGKFYHKKWGKNKIRHALKQKKIPVHLIEKVFAEEIPETEYQAGFDAVADKKLKELVGEGKEQRKQKLARFLTQRGFEWEYIRKRLSLLVILISFVSLFLVRCTQEQTYASFKLTNTYTGMASCQSCHQRIYDSYVQTGMGHSFYRPDTSQTIEDFSQAAVYDAAKDFYYRAEWREDEMFMREFRLKKNDTVYQRLEKVDFVVGSGHQTRSYLMQRKGFLYEMPLTWYVNKQIWDVSPGYEVNNSRFDREIGLECMACHTGKVDFVAGSKNRYKKIALGIDCEKCHGPGAEHIRLIQEGQLIDVGEEIDYSIVNPAKLPIDKQFDVCQQCHLQGVNVFRDGKNIEDFRPVMHLNEVMDVFIEQNPDQNAFGIASHAERLQLAQCFRQSDGQLTCTSCHNPHKSIAITDSTVYIRQCQSCHRPEKEVLCAEPVGMEGNCISCHMPQGGTSDIPHVRFHDHFIRVVDSSQQQNVADIQDFLRLRCATDSQPDPAVESVAWMRYFENHEADPKHLQRAAQGIQRADPMSRARFALLNGKSPEGLAALASYPDDAESLFLKGELYEAMGDFSAAQLAYTQSFAENPDALEAGIKSAIMLLKARQGDATVLPEVDQMLTILLQKKPFDKRILANLAFVKLNQRKVRQAQKLLEKALAFDPDYKQALINMVLVLRLQDDPKADDFAVHLKEKHGVEM